MDRRLWVCVAILTTMLATASGCQGRPQAPAFDPFINRATIPPPPTGAAVGGTAPAFNAAPAGAAGAYQPNGASLNPAQPYGPPPAFGSPPTMSAPAGQFSPPPIQGPAGSAPYAPPGGYNYQNQYRQGAANDLHDTTAPADEGSGRRQIAARNNYYEGESTVAFAGNSAPTSDDTAGVSQIRWAGETEDSNPGTEFGSVRTVSYESAAPADNQGTSTLRFVESETPRRPAPASVLAANSSTRNAVVESRVEQDDGRHFQPMETSSIERRPAESRTAPMHSIVASASNEVAAAPQTNFAAEAPAPIQVAAVTAPQSTARFAHDAQYQWLNGRLEYSQLDRRWKLRYIEIDGETDSFGGSVILPDAAALQGFQPGEFVTVRGSVDTSQTAPGSFAPAYRLQQIQRP